MTDKDKEVILALANFNMDVAKTSRGTYTHYNTIRYHIKKIKEETGLNPMNFYDLHKLVKQISRRKKKLMTISE